MERDARAGRSTDEAAGACERPFVASPVNRAAVPRVDDDGRVLAHHGGRKRGVGYLHNGLRRRYRGYPHAELPHHGRLGFDGGHAVPAYVACGGSRWRASLSPRRVRAPDASVCVAICRPYTPSATGINCTALSGDNNADWPLTASGDYTSGTCIAGWTGSPNRQCGLDGVFGAVQNPCTRTCFNRARAPPRGGGADRARRGSHRAVTHTAPSSKRPCPCVRRHRNRLRGADLCQRHLAADQCWHPRRRGRVHRRLQRLPHTQLRPHRRVGQR